MRDTRSDKGRSGPGAKATLAKPQGAGDAGSRKLASMARAVGNEELQQRLQVNTSVRDQLLDHLCARLHGIRELQQREIALTHRGAHYPWWRAVADRHKDGITKPEPARWAQPAQMLEQAAQALCRGDLGRGQALLDQAIQCEERVRRETTQLVKTEALEAQPSAPPVATLQRVTSDDRCGPRALPADVHVAWEIQQVTTEIRDIPNRKRTRDPWWTASEDEDEEEPGDGAAG